MSMEELIPPFLQHRSRVALVATARWIEPAQLQLAQEMFEKQGWDSVLADNVFKKHYQFAGSDEERALEFQRFLDDETIDAIVCVRGGYGSVRIIDKIDFSAFSKRPKWLCGYSDFTVFLTHVKKLGVASMHCSMPVSFADCTDEANHQLVEYLKGKMHAISWVTGEDEKCEVEGKICGGNLSVLYSLLGSRSMPDFSGSILFLEDVDEMYYHIDRMMRGLMRAGALNGIQAILLGGMTQMRDNTQSFGFKGDNPFGWSPAESIKVLADEMNIPVITGFPAGHHNDNRAFYLGKRCVLSADAGRGEVRWL